MRQIHHTVRRFEQTGDNCGPNSLAQLLSFYGDTATPEALREQTRMIKGIGTYDGHLGLTAIQRGYAVRITPANLYAIDPTWQGLSSEELVRRLRRFRKTVRERLLRISLDGYIAFLQAGGTLDFEVISRHLLVKKIQHHPLMVGLCSTVLYGNKRPPRPEIRYRFGHFVVVNGYNPDSDRFSIVDPWHTIPMSKTGRYAVPSSKLIAAMYLGEATYDCTIIEIDSR